MTDSTNETTAQTASHFLPKQPQIRTAKLCLASDGARPENCPVQSGFQKRAKRVTSMLCARPPSRRSTWQRVFPMPRPMRWPHRDLDCFHRAQSCRRRFDAVRPSQRGLACSISLLPDAAATPRQRHRKNPVGGDAFPNAATSEGVIRIRLYSCSRQGGHYAGFRHRKSTNQNNESYHKNYREAFRGNCACPLFSLKPSSANKHHN